MMFFDHSQQSKIPGSCMKTDCVVFGFASLLVEFISCSVIFFVQRISSKFWIHRGEFIHLSFDRQLQTSSEQHLFEIFTERLRMIKHQLWMQKPKMCKRMLCFLRCSLSK